MVMQTVPSRHGADKYLVGYTGKITVDPPEIYAPYVPLNIPEVRENIEDMKAMTAPAVTHILSDDYLPNEHYITYRPSTISTDC